MPSLRLERVDGAKAKQCHAHNVQLDTIAVTGMLSNALFHSSLSVCRFVGKVVLVISRASPECEGTGRVEFFVPFSALFCFGIMFTV